MVYTEYKKDICGFQMVNIKGIIRISFIYME